MDKKIKIIKNHNTLNETISKNIIDHLVTGIWICDKNDIVCFINKGMSKIAEITEEQVIGTNILKDFPEINKKHFDTYYNEAKKSLKINRVPMANCRYCISAS